jgi:hypothetical protein
MARIEVTSVHAQRQGESVWVEVEHVSEAELADIRRELAKQVKVERQVADAVANSFVYAVQQCPLANPSDVWQHLIYRGMLLLGYTDQQWKRISGFALERALTTIYAPHLAQFGLRMRALAGREAHELIAKLGLSGRIKRDKIDRIVEVSREPDWHLVAGIHVKSSLAERIQDDVPASLALMSKGILSIMLTMDSKSFPPPHGNGVNYGELGGRNWGANAERDMIKRQYVEDDGQFDAMISYNLRTPPSEGQTKSGKRIYTLSFAEPQPDVLVRMLKERADAIR